jgi:hypothetical protein
MNFVGQEVAFVLDLLDLIRFVPQRLFRREHLFEYRGTPPDLLGQRHEIVVETLFFWNQSKRHHIPAPNLSRIRLLSLRNRYLTVGATSRWCCMPRRPGFSQFHNSLN